ncbi:hypothetical protein EDB81DRAFT_885111 [Dactylonectria macrodidyma]|uniref:Uncharacterized protein n=1 Tax=Dactylonectria macrodidyma TaxID=307937 RepID=A0A9P9J3N4_9HYPO|nr:hypothetical protein EDB81DRAFT_885111 [Dactylonectria macrodidyma]
MPTTTAVKYDVREDILRAWLGNTFGESVTDTGLFNWSYESISAGHSSIWKVTAPREITKDEQHHLKLVSLPKKSPTFGRRKDSG